MILEIGEGTERERERERERTIDNEGVTSIGAFPVRSD